MTVDFDTLTELLEQEDELTWKHWPVELNLVELSWRPAADTAVQQAA